MILVNSNKNVKINYIGDEKKEDVLDSKMFFAIAQSMALSECGDRTQFTSMAMAAIFNFYGVIIGSCTAFPYCNTWCLLWKNISKIPS